MLFYTQNEYRFCGSEAYKIWRSLRPPDDGNKHMYRAWEWAVQVRGPRV